MSKRQIASERAELCDIVERTFVDQYGGRAHTDEWAHAVRDALPAYCEEYLIAKGIKAEIGHYARQKDAAGKPTAIAASGEYVQTEIALPEELITAARQKIGLGVGNFAAAQILLDRCAEVHGVVVTIADLRPSREAA